MLTQEPNTNKFSRVGAGCRDASSQCRSGGRSTSHELSSEAEKSWSARFLVLSWAGGENKKKSQPTTTTIGLWACAAALAGHNDKTQSQTSGQNRWKPSNTKRFKWSKPCCWMSVFGVGGISVCFPPVQTCVLWTLPQEETQRASHHGPGTAEGNEWKVRGLSAKTSCPCSRPVSPGGSRVQTTCPRVTFQ